MGNIRKNDLINHIIPYKEKLGFDNFTFGIELEFEKINLDEFSKILVNSSLCKWMVEEETFTKIGIGGEVISPVLKDKKKDYVDIKNICKIISNLGGTSSETTAFHIHLGAHLLKNNLNNYINLIKFWTAYEDVIYQFSITDHNRLRSKYFSFAKPYSFLMDEFIENYSNCDIKKFISLIDYDMGLGFTKIRSFSLGYEDMLKNYEYMNTVEIRVMNSTYNPVIIQNCVNFYGNMFKYVVSDSFDAEFISYKLSKLKDGHYEKFDYSNAFELSNTIFDNDIDKMSFLKQCLLLPIENNALSKVKNIGVK